MVIAKMTHLSLTYLGVLASFLEALLIREIGASLVQMALPLLMTSLLLMMALLLLAPLLLM